ncbi:Lysophospholipase NTE1 [Frankliniella fusca]|uniref:Lysophospholipase NTE1 n=1 Tax=Frankliniella fusca TaxID=407009 RepID=A0AAE1LF71_9NEOP|nr:Lysophospholipase NTE1 [Frankliniella fusca]
MPRITLDIWKEFYCETEGVKKTKATCKHCGKSWKFPNATRLKEHLEKCKKCPLAVKNLYYGNLMSGPGLSSIQEEDEDSPNATGEGRSGPASARKRPGDAVNDAATSSATQGGHGDAPTSAKRQALHSFLDRMPKEEKEKIDQALAAAVYANGLPLTIFENEHFQRAFTLMRPAYGKPPSRFQLGGKLLDREFSIAEAKVKSAIAESDCVALMADGCATVNREHVINFIATTPQPMLYTYKVMGTERETAELVAREFISVLKEIGPQRCYLVVTDNAAVMTAAMEMVTLEYPHITAVGCSSHCWNLLFKDIMSLRPLEKLFLISKAIVKSIRNVYVNFAAFKLKQKDKYGEACISLKLPSATRWGGAVITFNSLLKNKAAIQEIVVNEELNFSNSVRTWALDNVNYWERVKVATDMLKPLHGCITLIESNRALLSDVFYLQKTYSKALLDNLERLPFKNHEKNLVRGYLADREDFTIKIIHKTCFLLDPRFKDKHRDMLSAEDIVAVIDFIGVMSRHMDLNEGDVIASVGRYRTRTGLFANEGIWLAAERMVPHVWWAGVCESEPVATIARRLLSLPPSAAECERNWKLRKFIHSKTRNRLLNERVRKLVATKAALKDRSKTDTTKPFFTVAEIEAYFDNYLPARVTGTGAEGEGQDAHHDFEEASSEDEDFNDEDYDYEDISDWSDGGEDIAEGEREEAEEERGERSLAVAGAQQARGQQPVPDPRRPGPPPRATRASGAHAQPPAAAGAATRRSSRRR